MGKLGVKAFIGILILTFSLSLVCTGGDGWAQIISIAKKKAGGGGADYQVASGCLKCGESDYGPNNFKICVYNSSGTQLACSAEGTWAASSWVCTTFSNGPTLTPGNEYILGVINNGYNSVFTDGVNYSTYVLSSLTYATPPASITPPDGDGNDGEQFAVYLRNAANTKLVGNNTNYTTNESTFAGSEMYFYEATYTCDTL